MKISVQPTVLRGRKKFVVSRGYGKDRKRTYFNTRAEAEAEKAALEDQLQATGQTWVSLSARERADAAIVLHEVKDRGLTIRAVWEAYKQGTSNPNGKGVTLETALKETLAAKKEARRRQRYIDSLKEYLGKFVEGQKMLQVDRVTSADIEKWFASRKEAPSTRASNLGRLSSMFDLCYRRGYITFNPCDRVERVTVEVGRPVIFSADDTKKLVETCAETDPAFLPYIVIGVFTGIRPEECAKLKWSDVDLAMKRIVVNEGIAKRRGWRDVPIEENAVAWLKTCSRKKALIPDSIRSRRRRLCKLSGLRWQQDILRKTAASFLMVKYQDAGKVADWMHNSVKILRKNYRARVSPEECKKFWSIRP